MLKNLLNRILSTPAPVPVAVQERASVSAPVSDAVPVPPASGDVARADSLIVEGNALEEGGRLAQAEGRYRDAVAAAPGHARGHLNLGILLAERGDEQGAAAAYDAVLAIDPGHAFGNYNYARLAFVRGDLEQARSLLAAALLAKPEFPQALMVQSSVLHALGQAEPAVQAMEAALRLQPDDAGAWFNLAVMLQKLVRIDEAEAAVRRALAGEPDQLGALSLLSRLLRDQGFAAEALQALRPVVEGDPADWANRSFELLLMLFADGVPVDEIVRRHFEFGRDMERAIPARFLHASDRGEPQRRLRVGYLSRDFHLHTVPFFLMPVLEQHDRAQVEVFCYSYGTGDDVVTGRVRALTDHWREVADMSESELADAIHADRIDVLVDLVGHTGQPRLGVFSQKPAPVQVSWLGYLGTTGLTRMDFRLCDRRTDPMDVAQPMHTERLVHLPASQWCYRPMVDERIAAVAPVEKNGRITFGSFNAALKISPATCRRWGEVLQRVPGSRLVVANVNSQRKRDAIRRDLASVGVDAGRIEFLARVPLNQYLALYNQVDIALDTFPYGGGTTTFDALWMGVPVVAAIGETSVSRSAASILQPLDLDDWIAPSIDRYVDVAVARAGDREALAVLRRALRERLQDSLLTEMPRFVRDLETAYRALWMGAA